MIAKVTNKIGKGEIVFPTIGYPVKAGTKLSLTQVQFYASDIQSSLEQGLLEIVEDSFVEGLTPRKRFKVTNVKKGPITLQEGLSFMQNEHKYLSEEDYASQGVQMGIRLGWLKYEEEEGAGIEIKPESETEPEAEPEKPKRKRGRPRKNKEEKAQDKPKRKRGRPRKTAKVEEEETEQSETQLQAWDAHSQKTLDKDEAKDAVIGKVAGHVPNTSSDDVQAGDIDFTDNALDEAMDDVEASVKKTYKAKSASSKKKSGKKKAAKKKGKKKLQPVGTKRKKATANEAEAGMMFGDGLPNETEGVGELNFVDQEQERERKQSHPIIRRRIAEQNQEVE